MPGRSIPLWIMNSMLACWIVAISAGLLLLEAYGARPGARGTPSDRWPDDTPLRLSSTRPSLLIFLHPHCPCSRASIAELAWVISRCRGRVSVKAIVFQPDSPSEDWASAGPGIEQDLTDIPDIAFCYDPGGREARRFGVSTSGHILLFDATGRRIFDGGITPSRGHEGKNRGREEVAMRILDPASGEGPGGRPTTPIFGCPIVVPRAPQDEGH